MEQQLKTVLITGASGGIGQALATCFLRAGYHIGLCDLVAPNTEHLKAPADRLFSAALDVTKADAWDQLLIEFDQRFGRLDVLINNAGLLESGAFEQIDSAKQERMIQVNTQGVMLGCHRSFEYLKKTQGAKVINLSSASAIYGQASLAVYSATKFFVRGLTEALNIEWESHQISVHDLMPLFVKTHMVDGMDAKSIGRLGVKLTAIDVAEVALKVAEHSSPVQVHFPVGINTKLSLTLSKLSPDRLNRWVNKLITT